MKNKTTTKLPIEEKAGRFYLRKTFDGKQQTFPLGADKKTAITRCNRFLATFQSSGLDTAILELTGKKVLKAGCNPTLEEMEILYRDFCNQSAKSPSTLSIKTNVASLKLIMTRTNVSTIGKIDKNNLYKVWFKDADKVTPQNKRTFSSCVKCASSIFKISALAYYKTRNIELENPFKGMELVTPTIQKYIPISKELRETIWKNCQTELEAPIAMVCLIALGAGLRRTEIECLKRSWITVQKDCVTITIKEDGDFKPKVNEAGVVSIPLDLYKTLLDLRGDSDSEYFIPYESKVIGRGRLQAQNRALNKWLKAKGMKNQKAIHDLRKEYGSHIAKTQSILAASKALRNTVNVCGIYYSGIADIELVDIQESFKSPIDPLQAKANELGITLEALNLRLAKMS